jgi:hypothetical protein
LCRWFDSALGHQPEIQCLTARRYIPTAPVLSGTAILVSLQFRANLQLLHELDTTYEPLLMENPKDGDRISILDEWCSGFAKGVGLDSEGWLPLVVGKPDRMSSIMLYGTEEGWDWCSTACALSV